MDILAHAFYGATLCSRTGLAGLFRQKDNKVPQSQAAEPSPAGRKLNRVDWTLLGAAFFGVFPDIVSLAVPSLPYWLNGTPHEFFSNMDPNIIILYRYMHSLVVAVIAVVLLRLIWKPLFIPSLAWILHVLIDSLMHGPGVFQTTLFYPLSEWGFNSIRWWEHPRLVLAYWLLLPVIWLFIALLRWRNRERQVSACTAKP